VGLALEACKTLQPGETLLVCRPLAVLRRSEEAAAGLAADGSSSGGWVLPLDEEIEGLADQLAAAAAAGDSSGSRLQVRPAALLSAVPDTATRASPSPPDRRAPCLP
jgi:hypothetical protein